MLAQGSTPSATPSPISPGPGSSPLLGILGGLGPLASAEFVRTVYDLAPTNVEQHHPRLVLLSDPSFPDRTEYLLAGRDEELTTHLEASLRKLLACGVARIVIVCYTLHAVLSRVDPGLRRPVVSLVDLLFDAARTTDGRHLLLATTGNREVGVFEADPRWEEVREHFALPDARQQAAIHGAIYQMKADKDPLPLLATVEAVAKEHRVDSCAVGCTELHLLSRHPAAAGPGSHLAWLDPLITLARDLPRYLREPLPEGAAVAVLP